MPVKAEKRNQIEIRTVAQLKRLCPKLYGKVWAEGFAQGLAEAQQCGAGGFETRVREAISGGLSFDAAFQRMQRTYPEAAREYFKRIQAGGPDLLKKLEVKR